MNLFLSSLHILELSRLSSAWFEVLNCFQLCSPYVGSWAEGIAHPRPCSFFDWFARINSTYAKFSKASSCLWILTVSAKAHHMGKPNRRGLLARQDGMAKQYESTFAEWSLRSPRSIHVYAVVTGLGSIPQSPGLEGQSDFASVF